VPNRPTVFYGWTDLTYLLHRQHVSWGYYLNQPAMPACADRNEASCQQTIRADQVPQLWNPLPYFDTVNFDFGQSPRKPLLLPAHPAPGPAS
jgi:hypothetical protein